MDLAEEPGFTVLASASGAGSRTVPLMRIPTRRLLLRFSCAGPGQLSVRLGTQGPTAPCDGSPRFVELPSSGSVTAAEVTADGLAEWSLVVQEQR